LAQDVFTEALDDLRGGSINNDTFLDVLDQHNKKLRDIKRVIRDPSYQEKKRPADGRLLETTEKRMKKA